MTEVAGKGNIFAGASLTSPGSNPGVFFFYPLEYSPGNEYVVHMSKETSRFNRRRLITVVIFMAILAVLLVGGATGGTVALVTSAEPESRYLQELATVPVLNLVISPEKRSRAILERYLAMLEGEENLENFAALPFEYSLIMTMSRDTFFEEENTDITLIAEGGRVDQAVSLKGKCSYYSALGASVVVGEAYIDEEKLYVMPDNLNGVLGAYLRLVLYSNGIQDFENGQWFSIELDRLNIPGPSTDNIESITKAVLKLFYQRRAEYLGIEYIKGEKTYHYVYYINTSELPEGIGVAELEGDEIDVHFWFDDDFSIFKLSAKTYIQEMDIYASITFRNAEESQVVSKPKNAKSLSDQLDTN